MGGGSFLNEQHFSPNLEVKEKKKGKKSRNSEKKINKKIICQSPEWKCEICFRFPAFGK